MTLACIPDLDKPSTLLPADCDFGSRNAQSLELSADVLAQAEKVLSKANPDSAIFQYWMIFIGGVNLLAAVSFTFEF